MTNKELIEHLQKFPMDSEVVCVYLCCSDYSMLQAEQITFHTSEEIKNKDTERPSWYRMQIRYVKRNGVVMEYDPKTWNKEVDGEPKFLNVIAFPGN